VAVSPAKRAALRETLLAALARWHAAHPEIVGPNKAELLRFAAPHEAPELLEAALLDLVADGLVAREHAALRLPEHRPRLPAQDEALWSRVAPLLTDAGLRPPRLRELADALGFAHEEMERKLVRFERFGRLLRVADNRFFLPATVAALTQVAASLAAEAEDGTFTAAAFKDRSGIGRNLTIEVLEFLDKIGVSRRLGDRREVIRRAEDVIG
jgi:selenocysteine-specific elongation factor